jgi:hypothetical protein
VSLTWTNQNNHNHNINLNLKYIPNASLIHLLRTPPAITTTITLFDTYCLSLERTNKHSLFQPRRQIQSPCISCGCSSDGLPQTRLQTWTIWRNVKPSRLKHFNLYPFLLTHILQDSHHFTAAHIYTRHTYGYGDRYANEDCYRRHSNRHSYSDANRNTHSYSLSYKSIVYSSDQHPSYFKQQARFQYSCCL